MPASPFWFSSYLQSFRSQKAIQGQEARRRKQPSSQWNSVSFVFSEIQKFKVGNHTMNQQQRKQIHGSRDDKNRAIRFAGKIEPFADGRLNNHSADGSRQSANADNGTDGTPWKCIRGHGE